MDALTIRISNTLLALRSVCKDEYALMFIIRELESLTVYVNEGHHLIAKWTDPMDEDDFLEDSPSKKMKVVIPLL